MGIKYYGIATGKFRRYHKSKILNLIDPTTIYQNARDLFEFFKGIKEARNLLLYEKPDVVFAKGGFVSLPVGIAAWLLRTPLVIHESDTVMGLSNKIMSKFAKKVCVTFPKRYYDEVNENKLIITGNPIREDIRGGRGDGLLRILGFDKNRRTLLVLGGSQGSRFINESIVELLEGLLLEHQLIWITGERDASAVNYRISKLPAERRKYVKQYGFVTSEMADIYDASDLVISRGGSNVLFELAALGLPSILIPIEDTAGGHQMENAKYFSRNGAAYILSQKILTPKKLQHAIKYLFENHEELAKLSEKIKTLSQPDAADLVAKEVYNLGAKQIEQIRQNQKKG